ncbi:MAG: TrmH family RNA methyltransferase [Bryobacteraceae bacterium]
MQLTSTKNPILQAIRRAAAAGRPTEDGLIVAEGPHLVEEALRSEWQVEQVFATERALARYSHLLLRVEIEIVEVSERAFASTAATETTQEVLALVRPRSWSWKDLLGPRALVLALDGIQDPGNAGTIVRSAEAFGATGLVFLRGCVRAANGKLLRAAAGSLFRVPFLEAITVEEFVEQARLDDLPLYVLAKDALSTLDDAALESRCALAVGSEGSGISPELLLAAQAVSIPTAKVESLNAATACSIALFEAHRRRNAR